MVGRQEVMDEVGSHTGIRCGIMHHSSHSGVREPSFQPTLGGLVLHLLVWLGPCIFLLAVLAS